MKYKETKVIKFEDIPIEYQEEIYGLSQTSNNKGQDINYYFGIDVNFAQAKFYNYIEFYNFLIKNGFEKYSVVIIQGIKYNSSWLFPN